MRCKECGGSTGQTKNGYFCHPCGQEITGSDIVAEATTEPLNLPILPGVVAAIHGAGLILANNPGQRSLTNY